MACPPPPSRSCSRLPACCTRVQVRKARTAKRAQADAGRRRAELVSALSARGLVLRSDSQVRAGNGVEEGVIARAVRATHGLGSCWPHGVPTPTQ